MKQLPLLLLLLTLAAAPAGARKRTTPAVKNYAIGFYNLENLFDTCHDEGKNDYEYLPAGKNTWTSEKYVHKLRNMSRALADMGSDSLPSVGCAVIGLAEVENSRCLADLVSQPPLARRGYKYVHAEGPDQRGIDCALLYQPRLFQVRDVKLVPYRYLLPKDSLRATRGFLVVSGTLAGEHVTVVVCHLPSRSAESYYRDEGGRQLHALRDSLLREDTSCRLLIMGDMNDDPQDSSMADHLSAKRSVSDVGAADMYNPWWNELAMGNGTLVYQGAWNLFDQIIISPTLLHGTGTLHYQGCQVFCRDYLIQQDGFYRGSPLRTFGNGQWLDGFSDHLPTIVYLSK